MSDSLYAGRRFRTFNVIDDFNRELLHIEIDTSITGKRLIRVFELLRYERGLPQTLRTDNGPEFLSGEFVAWAELVGMSIQYIQPGKPNQNAQIFLLLMTSPMMTYTLCCPSMHFSTKGDGAIVAANANVTKSCPPLCAVGGNPASIIKENVSWARDPNRPEQYSFDMIAKIKAELKKS